MTGTAAGCQGTAVTCNDGDPCTADGCDDGACVDDATVLFVMLGLKALTEKP